MVTKEVVKLFVGFGGVEKRQAVADGADVYVEEAGLAGLLPIALSSYKADKLSETSFSSVFQQGLNELGNGKILFKDEKYRERIVQAHTDMKNTEQVFGE